MEINENVGTVSTTTTVLIQRQEDDWEQQQKNFEEVERWEKIGKEKLPLDLKELFLQYLSNFSGFIRMPVYKMMHTLEWNYQKLQELYDILMKIPRNTMSPMISLLESFVPYNIVLVCFHLLYHFKDYQIEELVMHIDLSDAHLLVQVCRHIPNNEMNAFFEIVNRLTLKDIIHLLKQYNEPMAKHCELCRKRRLYELEQHMLHEQVPKNLIKVPGTVALYTNNIEKWQASDEKGFTFDNNTANIYYQKYYLVDLIKICDTCLYDIHTSISNYHRYDEIYHLNTKIRKNSIQKLRSEEKGLAEIIYNISYQRNYRRGREYILKILQYQRIGLKNEENIQKKLENDLLNEKRKKEKVEEYNNLIKNSLKIDEKWKKIDNNMEMKRLDNRQAYVELLQREEYSINNIYHNRDGMIRTTTTATTTATSGIATTTTDTADTTTSSNFPSKERVHSRSWQLAPICSTTGKALLPEGASQIFGTYIPPIVNHDSELSQWKEHVTIEHNKFIQKQKDIQENIKMKRKIEIDRLCNHVKERMEELNFHAELEKKEKEFKEKERIRIRELERVKRRELRFEEYMHTERRHMLYEDNRSYQHRDYEWQLLHEQSEREDMFNEYTEQTQYDRYWGVDIYASKQYNEEQRLRKCYEQKVIELNNTILKTNHMKPKKKKLNLLKIGSLPMDHMYQNEMQRREAVIKALKAEEIRSKLHVRVSYSYT